MSLIDPETGEEWSDRGEYLIHLLNSLSADMIYGNDASVEAYISKFEVLYSNGFRHMYSELYPAIIEIDDRITEGLSSLLDNLDILCERLLDRGPEYEMLYRHMMKLSDHVSLEAQRILENKSIDNGFSSLARNYNMLSDQLDAMADKLQHQQTEAVAILAVFSAIVIAFSGGLGIIGNAMEGMSDSDPWMLMFSISLCGTVLFNTIVFLMNVILRLVSPRHIKGGIHKEYGWGLILGVNIMLLSMMVFSLWAINGFPTP